MHAPVIGSAKDSATMLELSEVTFIKLGENRRELLFSTQSSTLRLVRSIQEIASALGGTNFLRVDQDIIVNMERSIKYNHEEHLLLFEPSGSDKTSSCHVSRDNRAKVKKWFMTY